MVTGSPISRGGLLSVEYPAKRMKRIERWLRTEFPRKLPVIMPRAINKALRTVRTQTTRKLKAELPGLRAKDIRDKLPIYRKATRSRWEAAIRISGRRIPLSRFGARQTKKGVSYRVGPGRSRIPGAFIAAMASGHRGVYRRVSAKRFPIIELYGPSIMEAARNAPGLLADAMKNGANLIEKYAAAQIEMLAAKRR